MPLSNAEHLIRPDWDVPSPVKAVVTTRRGGVSEPPYDSFNLGLHVGDHSQHVAANRASLRNILGLELPVQWIDQQHGTQVFEAGPHVLVDAAEPPVADALITSQPGLPCAVMTADCLPVFLAAMDGAQVAVAHAGWRGLAAGILEQTVASFQCPAQEIVAWLGPAIGPKNFEVGPEVRQAFLRENREHASAFVPSITTDNHWMADLYQLAGQRLGSTGVAQVSGGAFCTFDQQALFYSYRRDGATGRMASIIWIEPD